MWCFWKMGEIIMADIEKIKKIISDNQDNVIAAIQMLLCVIFVAVMAKKSAADGKKVKSRK